LIFPASWAALILELTKMKYRHRVLAFLSTLGIITYLDRVAIAVAGPKIQEELGIGPEAWGAVGSVFAFAYGIFEIPAGILGDRIGPRRVLTRIVLWWSAFTTLTGMVSNYVALLVVRFAFGAGEAGAYPNVSVSISRWFPATERTRAIGIVWMCSQLGGVACPLLITLAEAQVGWRGAFYLFGLTGVAWSAAWYAWYRDVPSDKPELTCEELREIGDTSSRLPGHSVSWSLAVRNRNLLAIMGTAFCYVYGYYFFQSWLHTYLVRGRGFTTEEMPLSSLPYLLGAIGNVSGGFAGDAMVRRFGLRLGRRITGMACLAAASFWMAMAAIADDRMIVLVCLSLSYASITFQQPSMWGACVEVGRSHAGAVAGVMNTAAQAGSILSSSVFGYIVGLTGSYSAPLLGMAIVLLIGAGLWSRIDASKPLEDYHS
jgi:sugar phosphate permease